MTSANAYSLVLRRLGAVATKAAGAAASIMLAAAVWVQMTRTHAVFAESSPNPMQVRTGVPLLSWAPGGDEVLFELGLDDAEVSPDVRGTVQDLRFIPRDGIDRSNAAISQLILSLKLPARGLAGGAIGATGIAESRHFANCGSRQRAQIGDP